MNIKQNDATINRPKGDRIIDAPYMIIDLTHSIEQLIEEKAWDTNERNGITLFKSNDFAVVLIALHANGEMIKNTVDGYIMLKVLSGHVRLLMPVMEAEAKKDQLIILHPGIEHSILAVDDSILLLTNCSC